MAYEPLYTRLPETTRALERKYSDPAFTPTILSLPAPIRNSLISFDVERASRGQNPLSRDQSAMVALAALNNRPTTPPPQPNLITNLPSAFVRDARLLTSAIPKLPAMLAKEATSLTDMPGAIAEAFSSGNPIEGIAGALEAPGIRMLPGAFALSNLLKGGEGVKELATHPLFTLLDVGPAGKAVGKTKLGMQAKAATRQAVSQSPVGSFYRQTIRPSKPAQILTETFGKDARELSRMRAHHDMRLTERLDPEGKPYPDDEMVSAARAAMTLRKRYGDISEERLADIATKAQLDRRLLDDITDPKELAYLHDIDELAPRFANIGTEAGYFQYIDGELFDTRQAKSITSLRDKASVYTRIADIRDNITAPKSTADAATLLNEAPDAILDPKLGKKERGIVAEGYINALDTAGYNTDVLRSGLKAVRNKAMPDYTYTSLADDFRTFAANPTTSPIIPIDDILTRLSTHRRDTTILRLTDAIKSGDYPHALKLASSISRRTKFQIPEFDTLLDSIKRHSTAQKYVSRTSQFTRKAADKASAAAAKKVTRTAPARFQPLVDKQLGDRYIAQYADHPDLDNITKLVAERHYSSIPDFNPQLHRKWQREIASTWQDMKAQGINPIFLHKVTPNRAISLVVPKVSDAIRTPSQVKARTLDISPHIDDFTVALPHQGLEWLSRRGSEEFIAEFMQSFGRSEAELLDIYMPAARAAHLKQPTLDVMTHARRLMEREWSQFNPIKSADNPNGLIDWTPGNGSKVTGLSPDRQWIPVTVNNNLRRMFNPTTYKISAVFDPVMAVFRTSLLPLSPRWHIYNVLGGGIMAMGQTSPMVFTKWNKARKMINEGTLPDEMRYALGSSSRAHIEFNLQSGRTLRRLFEESMAGRFIQKSFDLNAFFDDTYRTMAYLYRHDKALTKGLSKEAAEKAGIQTARKTLQTWDTLTPIERSIMRYIFPFYGFMQHILRYTMKYPFDHPTRAAIIGSFARNEFEDFGTSLPERLLNSFFLGPMDINGNVKAINLAGMNPFADVANYMTLAGFLSATNPLIGTALEQAGIDKATGGPELFPTLHYDADSGRLRMDSPNPLQNLVQNTIPQSRILFGMAGASTEFKELMRRDPEAAQRLMLSQAGIPVLLRSYNIPQEQFKAELARSEDQRDVLNTALRTGDDSRANDFPALRPLLQQVRQLQESGQLDALQAGSGEQVASPVIAAQEALKAQVAR